MRFLASISIGLLVLMQALYTTAYSQGAPTEACEDMTPRHGSNVPQTSASPYTITATGGNTYTAGTTVEC